MRRWPVMLMLMVGPGLGLGGCALTNTDAAPTGTPGLNGSGAGVYVGASAGSSIGGGPLGAGTDDNRAGAR